jgi:hypothetical protein
MGGLEAHGPQHQTKPDRTTLGQEQLAPWGARPPNIATRPRSAHSADMETPKGGQGRGRTADLPLFRRSLVPTELPGQTRPILADRTQSKATQTGLEPATFAVTGRRANQLRHWAKLWYVPPTGFEPALPP